MKARITETKATAMVHELETILTTKIDTQSDRLLDRLFTSFKEMNAKVENCLDFAESRYTDTKREMLRVSTVAEAAVPLAKYSSLELQLRGLKV